MKAICRFCDDEITWDHGYAYWQGETGRCPQSPDFPHGGHLPSLTPVGGKGET